MKISEINISDGSNNYLLENDNGYKVRISEYGAALMSICYPTNEMAKSDISNDLGNVLLSYDNPADYRENDCYAGAVLAPNAGRIENASFKIDGQEIKLSQNDGKHNTHGGYHNLSRSRWQVTGYGIKVRSEIYLKMENSQKDGEDGYPGNRTYRVEYILDATNRLHISLEGETDKDTYMNLSNHCYFNLDKPEGKSALNQRLQVNASTYYLNNKENIIGNKESVWQTRFDFLEKTVIKDRMTEKGYRIQDDHQLMIADGYNHTFLLDNNEFAAVLENDDGTRRLTISTDAPSLVIYSRGKMADAIAIEPQRIPNEPNRSRKDCFTKANQHFSRHITFRMEVLNSSTFDIQ